MDQHIQRGQKWLETLLKLMGVTATVSSGRAEENKEQLISSWLTIAENNLSSETVATLIGNQGETIDAIQYLANVLLNVNTQEETQQFFTIELNGYRIRRQAELMAIAQKAADKVRVTGVAEEIRSLSSVERRQIHSFLEKSGDLATESQGNEPDRRLVVKLRQ